MGGQIDACSRFNDCGRLGLAGGFAGRLLGNDDVGVAFVVFGGDPVEVGFDGLGRGDGPGSDLGSKLCRRSLTQRPVGRDASADRAVGQNSLAAVEVLSCVLPPHNYHWTTQHSPLPSSQVGT